MHTVPINVNKYCRHWQLLYKYKYKYPAVARYWQDFVVVSYSIP